MRYLANSARVILEQFVTGTSSGIRTGLASHRGAARTVSVLPTGTPPPAPRRQLSSARAVRSPSTDSFGGKVPGVGPILRSPYRHLDIVEDVSLPFFMLNEIGKHGHLIALADGITGRELTYSQLKDQVIRVASALARWGLRKGDVVTLFSPNSIDFAVFFLAATSVGAAVSALSPQYTAGELIYAVRHCDSTLIVTVPDLVDVAKAAADECPACKGIFVFGEAEGCRPFSSLLEDDGKAFPSEVDIDPHNDLAVLPYSSGTTGLPKGVMLSHFNLVAQIQQLCTSEVCDYHAGQDVLLCVLPMFHIYGQIVVLLAGLFSGAKVVSLPKFDPQIYLNCVTKYKATVLHVVPPMVLFLAKHPMVPSYDFSSVHTMVTAAAPVGAEQIEEATRKTNTNVMFRQCYGLTETSPITNFIPNRRSGLKYSSIGPPVHNTLVKVLDLETGEPLGPGLDGELCVQGPQVMPGYLKNESATADTLRDGWLHTGDIGHYDEDGYLIISDRLKELIKHKGHQVAPAELEALLMTHPSILDVAVIGKPDERAGELPRAYVVRKPNATTTEKEVIDFVTGKVAKYKALSGGVEFRKEIPKSTSGKILRRQLRAEFQKK